MKTLLCSVPLIAPTATASAHYTMKMVTLDTVTWNDSTALRMGAKGAVLIGKPTKPGEVIVSRAKFPPYGDDPAVVIQAVRTPVPANRDPTMATAPFRPNYLCLRLSHG